MKKDNLLCIIIFIIVISLNSGCSTQSSEIATISANEDSAYINTFKELDLGIVYDFDFYLPNADKRWVKIWVERYHNGKKDPRPLTQLSYGNSPAEEDKGHVGFGIINPNADESFVFLYAPGVRQKPRKIESVTPEKRAVSSGYAIGDEKVELELGETKILGGYRKAPKKNSIKMYDFQNKEAIEQMIKEGNDVLLLKIRIKEEKADK